MIAAIPFLVQALLMAVDKFVSPPPRPPPPGRGSRILSLRCPPLLCCYFYCCRSGHDYFSALYVFEHFQLFIYYQR